MTTVQPQEAAQQTVERLRRQLTRERQRRVAAEEIGEQVSADLFETVQELRRAEAVKDAFVSNVSHELRTPLTSISGYLELLVDGDLGPLTVQMSDALGIVVRNAHRLRHLVEDLLALSAHDSTGIRIVRTEVDLGAVVSECRRSLAPTLAGRALTFSVECPPDLGPVHADRHQVERVLLNLLTNAIKFTPDGGEVTVSLAEALQGVTLTVSDTGIGIPAAEQERLFTRFFRSSLSVSSATQGTGLGLAVTKALVEEHGGSVTIRSVEGVGTTVVVELPSQA